MDSVIRVAIADDHDMVLNGVKGIIQGFGGFSIEIIASDGKELYEKLLAADQLPDIVIMDVSMPVWNGYDTLDAIRIKWPELKVLILTMHKHEVAIIRMYKAGANGYLLKNSPPKELLKAIRSILDTGLYFSELASRTLYHKLNSNIVVTLTDKEIQLLKYCHTDLTYKEIADKMNVSERSIAGYINVLFDKLNVKSRSGLIVCGIQMGIIRVE
jgi:two-component system, NarL family, invasion response regulator UvrY